MKDKGIKATSLLSLLWIFVLLNMIFRDLHQFLNKGFIHELLNSDIPETFMLLFGVLLEIPILMVVLSKILGPRANKWANFLAVAITLAGILYSATSADLDDIFFGLVEIVALFIILRVAFKLHTSEVTSDASPVLSQNSKG